MSAEKTGIVQEGRYLKERFNMKLRGTDTVLPVVINHTKKMVKIGDAILTKESFNDLMKMGPEAARSTVLAAGMLDGEMLSGAEKIAHLQANSVPIAFDDQKK